jgi:hypothetical protein
MFSHTLGEHSKLWCGEESDFIFQMLNHASEIHTSCTKREDKHWLYSFNVSNKEFLQYIGYGINALFSNRFDCLRWIDKTIGNTTDVPVLINAFPGAKFIHVIRDGRDVVTSMINSGFSTEEWSSNFEEACKNWVSYVNIALFYESRFPDKIIHIKVEDLSENFEEEMTKVLTFLDLDYEYALLDAFTTKHKNSNSSFAKEDNRITWREWTSEQRFIFGRWCLSSLVGVGYPFDIFLV